MSSTIVSLTTSSADWTKSYSAKSSKESWNCCPYFLCFYP